MMSRLLAGLLSASLAISFCGSTVSAAVVQTEKPIHIAEQTVDTTVCSDCYQDYLKGMWKICQS